jgi:hypothetical protein
MDSSHQPQTAEVVVYTDLDGVLQHEEVLWHHKRGIYMCPKRAPGRTLFEWTHYLVAALEPWPDVRLVLSSTWCIRPGYGRTLKRLPEELRHRYIGGTFHRAVYAQDPRAVEAFRSKPRGVQVCEDVRRRKPHQWLALDDDVVGWPAEALQNLIACDGNTGLSDERVREELQSKLEQCHRALK